MAKKLVALRLGQESLDELNYLALLTGQSQAAAAAEWIHLAAEAVKAQALADNPGMRDDQEFLMNGGSIISVEEQRAIQRVRRTLK
jgi:predicted DNA-binding protein